MNGEESRQLAEQINERMNRFDAKLDAIVENCNRCAREFGSNGARIDNLEAAHRDHLIGHRMMSALAASIGGIIVALGNLAYGIFRSKT
jgi:hypothetical protein